MVRYKGPVNATIIRRHQQWLDAAQVGLELSDAGPLLQSRKDVGSTTAGPAAPTCCRLHVGCCVAMQLTANPRPLAFPPPSPSPVPRAQTRTARHKIAKFLRQHAALAVSKGMPPPGGSAMLAPTADATSGTLGGALGDADARQVTWMVIQCEDRPGLLAEVANVIARHQHNITVRCVCFFREEANIPALLICCACLAAPAAPIRALTRAGREAARLPSQPAPFLGHAALVAVPAGLMKSDSLLACRRTAAVPTWRPACL